MAEKDSHMIKLRGHISIIIIFTYCLSLFAACPCYDDDFIKFSNTPINEISTDDFVEYLEMHEDCLDCRADVGVNINQFNNPLYKSLLNKEFSSLSENEFKLLLYLHEMGFDFQEKFNYFSNTCKDSTYTKLNQISPNEISQRDSIFLTLLHKGCMEQESDLEDGKLMIWKTVSDSNPTHVLKFRSFGRPFLGGAALAAGGIALTATALDKDPDNLASGLEVALIGLIGIILTAAGSGLFTFGAIKTSIDYNDYSKGMSDIKDKPFGPDFNFDVTIPIQQNK